MVDVDGVEIEVCADGGWRVHVRGDLVCIERCLVVVADGDGCQIAGGRFC